MDDGELVYMQSTPEMGTGSMSGRIPRNESRRGTPRRSQPGPVGFALRKKKRAVRSGCASGAEDEFSDGKIDPSRIRLSEPDVVLDAQSNFFQRLEQRGFDIVIGGQTSPTGHNSSAIIAIRSMLSRSLSCNSKLTAMLFRLGSSCQ